MVRIHPGLPFSFRIADGGLQESSCNQYLLRMTRDEMKARTKSFALRVMKMVDHLPKTSKGQVLGHQILRSATSVAANYRAACRGRSDAEFAAKLGTTVEEADETGLWLELIVEGGLNSCKAGEILDPGGRRIDRHPFFSLPHSPSPPEIGGFCNPDWAIPNVIASVAQCIERRASNAEVAGESPAGSTSSLQKAEDDRESAILNLPSSMASPA